MARRAVLIGVNKYKVPGADLRGCVNDVRNLQGVLTTYYGFAAKDIVTLTDYAATKTAMEKAIAKLVSGAEKGDVLLLHYSGHGSNVPDDDGDEADKRDEILCPTDLDWKLGEEFGVNRYASDCGGIIIEIWQDYVSTYYSFDEEGNLLGFFSATDVPEECPRGAGTTCSTVGQPEPLCPARPCGPYPLSELCDEHPATCPASPQDLNLDELCMATPVQRYASACGGTVIVAGDALGGLMKEKRRYLIVHFDDPDIEAAKGIVNFKLETKELLDSVVVGLAEKAKLTQRGDAYYRPKKPAPRNL